MGILLTKAKAEGKDILVMKEMLGGDKDVSAVLVGDEVKWIK